MQVAFASCAHMQVSGKEKVTVVGDTHGQFAGQPQRTCGAGDIADRPPDGDGYVSFKKMVRMCMVCISIRLSGVPEVRGW